MKSSQNKILTIAVVILLLANIGLVAMMVFSKRGHHDTDRGKGRTEPFEMMAKELSLTDQQQKDIKQMREDFFKANKSLFDSIHAAKAAFMGLIKEDQVSDSTLQTYIQKIAAIQSVADKLTFEHFKKVRATLHPDQQLKYDEFLKKMMTMRGRRDSADHK